MYVRVHAANWRASCAPPFGLFLRTLAAPQGAPFGRHPAAEAAALLDFSKHERFESPRRYDRSLLCKPAVRARSVGDCFCGRMPPKWAPVARRAGGGKARRGARRMRARALRAHGCALSDPRNPLAKSEGRMPGDRATWGVFLLVTFLCTSKEKLPARPQGEWKLCTARARENDQDG